MSKPIIKCQKCTLAYYTKLILVIELGYCDHKERTMSYVISKIFKLIKKCQKYTFLYNKLLLIVELTYCIT